MIENLYQLAYELNPGEVYFLRNKAHMKSRKMQAIINRRVNDYFDSYHV